MEGGLSTIPSCGRRGFLRAAASSPLLWTGLDQQTEASVLRLGCTRDFVSEVQISLTSNQAFVTAPLGVFPTGYFGFSLGHSHEVQLLLSRQLGALAREQQKTLVQKKFQELVGLFEEDQVALVPAPDHILAPLFLLPDAPANWPMAKAVAWSLREYDLHITGNACVDLLLELMVETLGLKELLEPLGKVAWKIVGEKMLGLIEEMVRARNWSGLAELASSLLEKLVSREAVILLGEVGGAVAKKRFLGALAARFVPFVGTAIFVITLVGLVRNNWDSIQARCWPAKVSVSPRS